MKRRRKKIAIVAGARPNFMKLAPVARALKKCRSAKPFIIHTGQHYDPNMSLSFFKELGIPKPNAYLGDSKSKRGNVMAHMMIGLEKVLRKENPDWVVVVGDVNSTLAAALVASQLKIKIAHIESGMRSFDRSMPEEINRIMTDHLSNLLFTSHKQENKNLIKEGIPKHWIHCVGDVMADNLLYEVKSLKKKTLKEPYAVLTLHRPANVDHKPTLRRIANAVNKIAVSKKIYFPMHPRTRARTRKYQIRWHQNVKVTQPMGCKKFMALYKNADFVMTDSGSLQLETSILEVPCLTLRENTERRYTLVSGTNILVGSDPKRIVREASKIMKGKRKKGQLRKAWDGKAAERIVRILLKGSD